MKTTSEAGSWREIEIDLVKVGGEVNWVNLGLIFILFPISNQGKS